MLQEIFIERYLTLEDALAPSTKTVHLAVATGETVATTTNGTSRGDSE